MGAENLLLINNGADAMTNVGTISPLRAMAAKAGQKDPRFPQIRAFDATGQPDIRQLQSETDYIFRNSIPFSDAILRLHHVNTPPQIKQITFFRNTSAVINRPSLYIPANPFRMSFLIANMGSVNSLFISYDFPVAQVAGVPQGIPIAPRTFFTEQSGMVSINDIYVWSDVATQPVIGFEGTLSIEGNL